MIKTAIFGTMPDGQDVKKYQIINSKGNMAEFSEYGATFVSCFVPDRNGSRKDVLVGFDTLDGQLKYSNYQGMCVGRHCNRIAGGKFTIDGTEYQADKNEGGAKSLHSSGEFSCVVWSSEVCGDNSVKFSFTSPDGTFGFPGRVTAEVIYTFSDDNEVIMDYKAVSDKATLLNFTNHAYFNLAGCTSGDVLDHIVCLKASHFTPTTADSIPTGEIRPVKGTPYDFTEPKPIGRDIGADYDQLIDAKGYDHNFCLDEGDGAKVCVLEPLSGRTMEVYTDLPGVQFYTGNFLDGKPGKDGKPMNKHAGFCLETQYYPDSPNHPNFPQCIFKAGEEYKSKTVYKFGVKND